MIIIANDQAKLPCTLREAPLRPQAERFRWSDQARLQEEGQDHEKNCAEIGMHQVQGQVAEGFEALQDLRTFQRA